MVQCTNQCLLCDSWTLETGQNLIDDVGQGYTKMLQEGNVYIFFYFLGLYTAPLLLMLSVNLRYAMLCPSVCIYFGLSFRTIICKLQFLVLIYMQR